MDEVRAENYEPKDRIYFTVIGSIASEEDLIKIIRETMGDPPSDEEPQPPTSSGNAV